MEKIGIVLLNYNDFESVFDFIRFVEPYSNIIELALVDNNSTDGSYEKFLEFNKKWIHVIKAQSNNGYASGNNLGLRYLALNFPNIKVLCISNPDVILNKECLIKILESFSLYPDYAVLTGVMYNPNGSIDQNPYLDLPTLLSTVVFCFWGGRRITKLMNRKKIDFSCPIQNVPALPGCFFAIRKKFLDQIGYLDENTFLYCEENILAKQVCLNGFKCGIITSATYIHNHSVSINKTYNEVQKNKMYNSSFLYYFKKYEKKTPLMITLLKCAMFLGNIELSIITLIRKCLHI